MKLKDLRDQRRFFDQKVNELRVAYRSEQKDAEKLESRSLANYFYQVVGKLDDQLTLERKQITSTSFFKIERQIPEWTDHVTVAERGLKWLTPLKSDSRFLPLSTVANNNEWMEIAYNRQKKQRQLKSHLHFLCERIIVQISSIKEM